MNKITVIGAGSVGSTVAYTLAVQGIASEIVIIDIKEEKAIGEALDIRHGLPFCTPCSVYAGTYADAANSNIVVITSGLPRKPGQSRLDLAQVNIDVTKKIMPEITRYAPDAVYLIVSNPVDVLTYAFCKRSGLPESRIIGSGTILDTARLRSRLSEIFSISQNNVHAYIMGEHGDSSFAPWSLANISNIHVDAYAKAFSSQDEPIVLDHDEIEEYVRTAGGKVIQRKGATFYGVSMSVAYICKCLLSGINTTMTVSTMMHGEYGIDDVCLSVLNIVGRDGAEGKVIVPLTDEEVALLNKSAESLKEVIRSLDI